MLVNGGAGFVVIRDGAAAAVAGFTVADGKVTEMDLLVDPQRLAALDLSAI